MYENQDPSAAGAANAALLRAAADTTEETARRLDLRVASLHYEGPAATHFREVMGERHRRAQRAAADLRQLAEMVAAGGGH